MARGVRQGLWQGLVVLALTLLTQIGGLAWLLALLARRLRPATRLALPRFLGIFALAYAGLWIAAYLAAPLTGRVALPCFGEPLRLQNPAYCALNRHYVTPDLLDVATKAAAAVQAEFPGTVTLALDAGFPFLTGMPLLPHLSHDDGEKLDFAFYYRAASGYLPGQTRSPIGYWAFEIEGDPVCPAAFPTLRWGMAWLQPFWPDLSLDPDRTTALIRHLAADPRVSRLFIEPPLAASLNLSHPKLRFQGCRAARHDDHIHLQL